MKKLVFFLSLALVMMACSKPQPAQDLETSEYSFQRIVALADGAQDSLYIRFHIEFPTAGPDSVLPAIQGNILWEVFGEDYADKDIQSAIQAYAAMLEEEYLANNLPLWEEAYPAEEEGWGPVLTESHDLNAEVLGIQDNILSYSVSTFTYMGGAHGVGMRMIYNYNMETGEPVHQEDIFVEGFGEEVTKLLLSSMIAANPEFSDLAGMRRYGYMTDEIGPNDNFFLTDEGITFIFNPYDIAPYAVGETDVFLSWDDIMPYLQEGIGPAKCACMEE